MLESGLPREEAQQKLAQHGGVLRRALADIETPDTVLHLSLIHI